MGKSLEVTAKVFNSTDVTVQMYLYVTKTGQTNANLKWVTVPKDTNGFQTVSSTQLIIPDCETLICMFTVSNSAEEDLIYVDDISLVII